VSRDAPAVSLAEAPNWPHDLIVTVGLTWSKLA
jgi:hypothetical protein